MHLPDGFLDAKTAAATAALSFIALGGAMHGAKIRLARRTIPLMGVAGAFVFAAQMINFPVAAGTSGHLMGSVLAAVLLGPGPAVIVMTSVLLVQALVFADGGVLALGANVFNMAVVGTAGGYGVYWLLIRGFRGDRGRLVAAGVASWFSIVLAATCVAGELAWSGTVSWNAAFPAMASVHMVIGLGEAIITTLVIAAISLTRPELLAGSSSPQGYRTALVLGFVATVGLVVIVLPFASPWPDGLERVASLLGFEQRAATEPLLPSILRDYVVPGVRSPGTAMALAGLIGCALAFGLSALLARTLLPSSRSTDRRGS
jgi:cobalt/nickel transport system permease protein